MRQELGLDVRQVTLAEMEFQDSYFAVPLADSLCAHARKRCPMNPFVVIIVLNWRKPIETLACLESLSHITYPETQIVVVDNGSGDDSVAMIRTGFPQAEILETGTNLGYAGGNNVGVRYALAAGGDSICILNNDVVVEPAFLGPLLAALQAQPDVGIVTPLVAEQSDSGYIWALGSAVNWRTAEISRLHIGEAVVAWRQREPFEVEIASGAAMLVKREVFERAGLMAEDFFLYYEEVDWCLKVRRAGYRILAVPASVVWHKVSATLGATSPIIDYYMLRNHLRLIGRHWRGIDRWRVLATTVMRNLITVAAYSVKSHHGKRIPSRDARLLALRDAALGRSGKQEGVLRQIAGHPLWWTMQA